MVVDLFMSPTDCSLEVVAYDQLAFLGIAFKD